MHTTNYTDTLIAVSPDSRAEAGRAPEKEGSIAQLQYALLSENPYGMTSDDLLFEVHARRKGIADAQRDSARTEFFAKPQACLRASPLVKQFGWGLHHDARGRVALCGVETDRYRELGHHPETKVVQGMRSKRA